MKQTETDFNPIATALIASVKVIFADLRKVISFRDAGGVFTFICRGQKDSRIFNINQSGTRQLVASDQRFARILRPLFHMIGVRNLAIPTAQPPRPEVAPETVAEPATVEVAKPQENPTQPRPEPYNSPH